MNSENLKISVIIRTYNSEKFVCNAVNSALNQTLSKNAYEVLVIDDGSKDNTPGMLEKCYEGKIRIIKQKHLGQTPATNNAILQSFGEHVTLLDSDDEFLPETLETMLGEFEKDKSLDFAYCDYFEKTGNQQKIVSLKNNIFKTIATAIMFKKKLFDQIGLYDEKFFFAEYDFLIRLIKSKKIGKHIPVPLYIYIRQEGSLTSNSDRVEKDILQLKGKYGDIADKIRKY